MDGSASPGAVLVRVEGGEWSGSRQMHGQGAARGSTRGELAHLWGPRPVPSRLASGEEPLLALMKVLALVPNLSPNPPPRGGGGTQGKCSGLAQRLCLPPRGLSWNALPLQMAAFRRSLQQGPGAFLASWSW